MVNPGFETGTFRAWKTFEDGGGDWFYNTPFHFPQGAVGVPLAYVDLSAISGNRTGRSDSCTASGRPIKALTRKRPPGSTSPTRRSPGFASRRR